MAEDRTSSPWLLPLERRPDAPLRLFLFAHAGASAQAFSPWRSLLPPEIEPWAIELPGRGPRLHELPELEVAPLVEGILPAITPLLDRRFAFFGQSMGSVIAFEVAHALRAAKLPEPVMMIVSGIHGPQRALVPPNLELDDEAFVELLKRYDTPDEWLHEPDLRAVFLPLLRADFELLELYEYVPREKLTLPLVAMGGSDDPMVEREALEAWGDETRGPFRFQSVPGDHFYFQREIPALVEAVVAALKNGR